MQHTIVDRHVPATVGVDVESNQRVHYFPGLIDEIRISKSADTASQINAAYQNIAGFDGVVHIGPERKVNEP